MPAEPRHTILEGVIRKRQWAFQHKACPSGKGAELTQEDMRGLVDLRPHFTNCLIIVKDQCKKHFDKLVIFAFDVEAKERFQEVIEVVQIFAHRRGPQRKYTRALLVELRNQVNADWLHRFMEFGDIVDIGISQVDDLANVLNKDDLLMQGRPERMNSH